MMKLRLFVDEETFIRLKKNKKNIVVKTENINQHLYAYNFKSH